jgi:hypothetical protein
MQYTRTKKITITDEKATPLARGERLKRVRNMANLTRSEICEGDSGINMHTYKSWENGYFGGLPKDGAEKIVLQVAKQGVKVTTEWLLHEIGSGPQVIADFLKLQDIEAGKTSLITIDQEESIIQELKFFRQQFSDCIDFKVEDDGMLPFYKPGDYVAGINKFGKNINKLIGLNCIIQLKNGCRLLRILHEGMETKKYNLLCSNMNLKEPVIYNADISSAAVVIRHYCKNPD